MPKVSEYYGSTYLSGADLGGKTHRLQVADVAAEEIGDDKERKLVVAFRNAKKSLVLNKTNASAIVSAWGDDTDAWRDRWLECFTVPTTFGGRVFDGLRVRPLDVTPSAPPPAAAINPAEFTSSPDDLPF